MTTKICCRFYDRYARRCTGEAVDPAGEILICQRHLGYAIELLKSYRFTVTPSEAHNCADCAEGVGIHPKES